MKKLDKFLSSSIHSLIDLGVGIDLVQSDRINYGSEIYSNGYFDDSIPKVAVAIQKEKENWIGIFVHEYSHVMQWIERDPIYFDSNLDIFDDWLIKKKEFSQEEIDKCINVSKLLEMDADKRAIDILERWNISDKFKRNYIKKSNAYIFFYEIVKKYRQWYKIAPYDVPEILNLMNDSFYESYDNIPKEIEDLMVIKCL